MKQQGPVGRIVARKIRHALRRKPFLNPYYDQSEPRVWPDEVEILRRIFDGERLVTGRVTSHTDSTGRAIYAVYWYWEDADDQHPGEFDAAVMRLMSRNVIRKVQCAGGAAHMVLTPAAEKVFGKPKESSW